MPKFSPVGRGVLVKDDDDRILGLAPHGLSSTDALAAVGYALTPDGELVHVAPDAGEEDALFERFAERLAAREAAQAAKAARAAAPKPAAAKPATKAAPKPATRRGGS